MTDSSSERTDRATQRFRFLAQASEVISSSLDYQQTLSTVARLMVPELADWCAVDMRGPHGGIERLAVAHIDPDKVKWAIELQRRFPPKPDAPTGVPRVLRTGESEFYPMVTDEMIRAAITDPEMLEIVYRIGFTSVITVPLSANGETLGAITFVTAESGRQYEEDDLTFAQELGRRAGLAVANSRLYSEVRQANEMLRRQSDRLDSLISSVPGVVWEAWGHPDEASQRIDFVSTYVSTMLGYTVEEWLGTPNFWLTIVHPDDRERAAREASEIFSGDRPGISAFRWIAKDGRALWVEARSSVIRDENGQSVGMRGMTFDMSERKETEERLERAREEAESANRAKDQFLAMLSHELRTPLTPVLTIAQVLEADHDLPDSLRPLIEIVRRNVELEARLIDDLLDLNRIIRGKLPLNTETVDAHGLLRNVVEICQSDLHGAGVRLLLDLGATRTIINADPARVQQVLWNLLKNGIKFTPSDGSITVRTSNDEQGRLVISFRDTGIGIEQSALPKIFQAFEQGAPIITKNFGGLGLGLAISKAIADLHGASLRAESDGPGEGATFTFIIETIDSDTAATTHQRMASIDEDHGKSWRILFVDDHEDTGRVNQLLLERRGYQVKLAHSVTEAKQFSDNEEFDLVISDIGLPDGNGLDIIRYLREHHQSIKGIALSGFGMEEDVVRSMEAGFNHHLTKPVTFNRLLEVIETLMRKGQ